MVVLLGFWFLHHFFFSVFAPCWLEGAAYILSLSSSPNVVYLLRYFTDIFSSIKMTIKISHHTCGTFLLETPAFHLISSHLFWSHLLSPHFISSSHLSCHLISSISSYRLHKYPLPWYFDYLLISSCFSIIYH